MSAREWKPGDLALVKYRVGQCTETNLCAKTDKGWDCLAPGVGFLMHGDVIDARPLVVIDPEDREQVERLCVAYVQRHNYAGVPWDDREQRNRDLVVDSLAAALREFANPTPRRVWTDGDVVQHIDGNYTAQRHDGEWRTTTGGYCDSKGYSDEYVTNHVEAGRLRVLREQAAEANA